MKNLNSAHEIQKKEKRMVDAVPGKACCIPKTEIIRPRMRLLMYKI